MIENLRTRVARLVVGDAAPVAVLEQAACEVDQLTEEVRAELGKVAANRYLAEQQHMNLHREHEELYVALETALTAGKDDLARTTIARQVDIEAQLTALEASQTEKLQKEKELAGYVDALKARRREIDAAIRDFETSLYQANNGINESLAARKVGRP